MGALEDKGFTWNVEGGLMQAFGKKSIVSM